MLILSTNLQMESTGAPMEIATFLTTTTVTTGTTAD
jgi:hypothetical protein